MPSNYFSVSIFFIVFRETVEAAIIVSVLLSFVEQLMTTGAIRKTHDGPPYSPTPQDEPGNDSAITSDGSEPDKKVSQMIRRMRIQIWAGTIGGFVIALAIGAAFIAVFYTKLTNLWADTEQIWEGVFSAIASVIIYVMGIAFLKMDRSRVKWRLKLYAAFHQTRKNKEIDTDSDIAEHHKSGSGGKWALFLLPFITVLREGLEAVVFVGGVSLSEPATSIPIAVIVGIIAGALVGYAIYRTGSSTTLHWFLVGSTTLLFLIGAGLFSKAVGFFEYYVFAKGVGGDVAETGDGPGSFRVAQNVWHLTYGNPEVGSQTTNGGWQIFNSIFGWNNTASVGTILAYIFYWLLIVATLVYLKWSEGRITFFGMSSPAKARRDARRAEQEEHIEKKRSGAGSDSASSQESPALPESPVAGARALPMEGAAESPLSEKGNPDMKA